MGFDSPRQNELVLDSLFCPSSLSFFWRTRSFQLAHNKKYPWAKQQVKPGVQFDPGTLTLSSWVRWLKEIHLMIWHEQIRPSVV
jgi:hypothetical protein